MKSLTSGWSRYRHDARNPAAHPCCATPSRSLAGDIWRTTRVGRLLATTVGVSAIDTEKLGWVRPGWTKYLTRGPCAPIAVEIKIVPATPVCALVRLAISTTSSPANSSASDKSGGIRAASIAVSDRHVRSSRKCFSTCLTGFIAAWPRPQIEASPMTRVNSCEQRFVPTRRAHQLDRLFGADPAGRALAAALILEEAQAGSAPPPSCRPCRTARQPRPSR